MARREFLQLAKPYKPGNPKVQIAGWLISEKLDGTRCLWDGGITRGMLTDTVPYASLINPKTGLPKKKIKPIATGLWSRYGNPIMAPDWFLDSLPQCPLDGELWAGRGKFQLCRSICGGDKPDPRFDQIKYACYSMPPIGRLLAPGEIKNVNFHCTLTEADYEWFERRCSADYTTLTDQSTFRYEYDWLRTALVGHEHAFAHEQSKLSPNEQDAQEEVEACLRAVLMTGGEGVVIRDPNAHWTPKRVNALLKYKPFDDAEGTITGFISGRLTDKGSKHLGMIGALILDFNGKRLELAGFTLPEREFINPEQEAFAVAHPGVDMPANFSAIHFKVGQTVTFKYRELSDDGIPKEARYFRKRDVE
jgi:DNA ligase-1